MMRNAKQGASLVFALFFVVTFLLPHVSLAQEVPVKDAVVRTKIGELVTKFTTYNASFDKYAASMDKILSSNTDSLKNIITGADPEGESWKPCATTQWSAQAYTTGHWASSSELTNSTIPKSIDLKVNDSASLRCLLQELVEWQKLDLSIQLHSMLKSYIADAQAKQLNGQLLNQISAAKLNWGKAGNTVVNNGIITSEPVYNTNASQSIYNVKSRQLDHTIAQAVADPNAPSSVGSLAICEPWRLDTAANVVTNTRDQVEDPFHSARTVTACPLANDGNDFAEFSDSFNSPSGGLGMFLTVIDDPSASPLGSAMVTEVIADGRIARQEQAKRDEFANTGARAVVECSGTPEDPYCLDEQYGTAVTPAYQTERAIGDAASQGDRQVESGDTLDSTAYGATEQQSVIANTQEGGLLGYDETPLALSKTAVDQLVREFYDVIEIGYFGVNQETQKWAQATMLMIYDEMKFDPTSPVVVVTNDEEPEPVESYEVW